MLHWLYRDLIVLNLCFWCPVGLHCESPWLQFLKTYSCMSSFQQFVQEWVIPLSLSGAILNFFLLTFSLGMSQWFLSLFLFFVFQNYKMRNDVWFLKMLWISYDVVENSINRKGFRHVYWVKLWNSSSLRLGIHIDTDTQHTHTQTHTCTFKMNEIIHKKMNLHLWMFLMDVGSKVKLFIKYIGDIKQWQWWLPCSHSINHMTPFSSPFMFYTQSLLF